VGELNVGRQDRKMRAPLAALTLATLLVFVLDLFVHLPIGAAILYLPVLLVAAWTRPPNQAWWLFVGIFMLSLATVIARGVWVEDPTLASSIAFRLGLIGVALLIIFIAMRFEQTADSARVSADANRLNAEEFRALAENIPDVVARFDRQLRHVYVNRAIIKYTGMPPEAFLGKDHVELNMPSDLVTIWQAKIRQVFDTAQAESFEYVFTGPPGSRHFECRLVPELAADGSVQTVLGINRDTTDTIRAQEQAQSLSAQLAHLSRLSTIGSLVSEIAHEINQPLHAITNYSEASLNVLENCNFDRKAQLSGWIRQILDQAKRAAEIIRRSSRFARKAPVRKSTVDINELVRECLRLVHFDLRAHRVRLRCDFGTSPSLIVADAIQVQQVIVNLLRNAIDAMSHIEESERRLVVRTVNLGVHVQISIRDN
jgi:PAS domain S-box-containing protein